IRLSTRPAPTGQSPRKWHPEPDLAQRRAEQGDSVWLRRRSGAVRPHRSLPGHPDVSQGRRLAETGRRGTGGYRWHLRLHAALPGAWHQGPQRGGPAAHHGEGRSAAASLRNSWRSALEPSNGSSRSWERVCWNELPAASHHFDRGHKSSTVSEWRVIQDQLFSVPPIPHGSAQTRCPRWRPNAQRCGAWRRRILVYQPSHATVHKRSEFAPFLRPWS